MQKPIITPEEIFQFCYDQNQERKRELQYEDAVRRMATEISYLNLN